MLFAEAKGIVPHRLGAGAELGILEAGVIERDRRGNPIRETYELPIVTPPIPKTIRFAEAPAFGRTILGTSKSHKGAEAYRQVAAGLLNGTRP